jgi:hypothetical protein
VAGGGVDDAYWRRPSTSPDPGATPAEAGSGSSAAGAARDQHYHGPPPTTPPPTGWQPPQVLEPAPPRPLPAQDHARIDADEARARQVTMIMGMLGAVVLLGLLCALCARTVF